jgi:hypothetical protein
MKKRVLILASLLILTIAVFGDAWPFDPRERPTLALPQAYQIATQAMGSLTNDFYCVSAATGSGEWEFVFYNTNAIRKTALVEYDKKVFLFNGKETKNY